MRYNRTKDGRIFETNGYDYWNNWILYSGLYPKELEKFKKTIIKQADTIEELCDELIIKNPNGGDIYRKVFVYEGAWQNILNKKYAKHCTNRDIYEHDVEIFGAIWVINSNGVPTLHTVAKMNEKGELELL